MPDLFEPTYIVGTYLQATYISYLHSETAIRIYCYSVQLEEAP